KRPDSRIDEQHIETPEPPADLAHELVDLPENRRIGPDGERPTNRLGRAAKRGRIASRQHDVRALGRERLRRCEADAAVAPGDEDRLFAESRLHGFSQAEMPTYNREPKKPLQDAQSRTIGIRETGCSRAGSCGRLRDGRYLRQKAARIDSR